MANQQGPTAPARKFIPVTVSQLPKGGTRRKGLYARMEINGYTTLSASASDEAIIQALAIGATRREFVVRYGVNLEAGSVAVFVEKPGYPGATGITLSRNDQVVAFHMGNVFEEYPDLRPATRIKPVITLDEDDGQKCLVVQIKGAKQWIAKSRDENNNAPKKTDK